MDVSRTSSVLILIFYYYYYTPLNDCHVTSNMLMARYKLEAIREQEVLRQALLVLLSVLK
jgi:hypothetical protein